MKTLALFEGAPVRTNPWPVYPQFGEREIEAATRVIRSGQLCAQSGDEVRTFEQQFAQYMGVKHAIAVANGTTAIHTALAALDIGPGDEVIVPALTFIATGTAVLMQNAMPLFADIETDVQGLDVESARRLVSERTKAIIVVALNGFPPNMDALLQLAKERGLVVIEDAAHAHGAEYKGRKIGSLSKLGCFSFHQKKNLSLGEGGMITCNDDSLAEKCREIRSFGTNVPLAYNYRMTELHAAIGQVRLKELDALNETRIRNAEYLHCQLQGIRGIRAQTPLPDTKCVYYNFIIHYNPDEFGVSRNRFMEAIRAEGVPVHSLYYPLYRHPSFRNNGAFARGRAPENSIDRYRRNYQEGSCPRAEANSHRHIIEVKVHPPATFADMDDVATAMRKVIEFIHKLR
ncbi:MAG: DegT/DnrJ/EryC1/StrS family aminotransferase [Verrucomicrobia bacterium]|nr:DegT/DnrJ/EryC1/StrS family aminotransferase [Verrucomicrobiota bacterium]